VPRWPLIIQALSAVIMLSFSAYYHHSFCKCESSYDTLLKFDLAGICVMIGGSSTAPFYYTLMCEETMFWCWLWMGLVWITSIGALLTVMSPKAYDSRWTLIVAFVTAGFATLPGLIHIALFTEKKFLRIFSPWSWVLGLTFYAVGAVIYGLKFPEKYS